jgi:hypothetical protein
MGSNLQPFFGLADAAAIVLYFRKSRLIEANSFRVGISASNFFRPFSIGGIL